MRFFKKNSFQVGKVLVYSQEAISASIVEGAKSVSLLLYFTGQLFYANQTTTAGRELHRVKYPSQFQIFSNTEGTTVNLNSGTHPNPTKNFVVLKITDCAFHNLQYTFFDEKNTCIVNDVLISSSTQIQMKYLYRGSDALKGGQKNKSLKRLNNNK
jgi:hypothetical protein